MWKDLITGTNHTFSLQKRNMTDEAIAASRATLTCEDSSHSQVARCLCSVSPISPGISDARDRRGWQSGVDHYHSKLISQSPELDLLSQIVRRNRYSLTDWANFWRRTHSITQYRNSKASSSEGSRGLTPLSFATMEKIHHPKSYSSFHPLTVSVSWVWKDDPVEIKERKSWQRSYSNFMRSPYIPRATRCSQTPSKQQIAMYRVARCRAWLNSHSGWLQ